MGRRRKQPRRIVTFNLNQSIADEIDDLRLPNRSEWANKVLREVLDGRTEDRQLRNVTLRDDLAYDAEQRLLNELLANPARLTQLLINSLNDFNIGDERMKGRFSIEEQLLILRNELMFGRLKEVTETVTYEEAVEDLKERLARGDI